MRKLIAFEQVSLDGYFTDANNDIGWAHAAKEDAEWNAFVAENAKSGGVLLFGRVTYEMMVSYWPTPAALQNDRVVAEQMNALPKVVFSRKVKNLSWNNTRLVQGDLPGEIRRMKKDSGEQIVVLGSGTIVSQLAQARLIDEYQLVVNPIVLGKGRTLFDGLSEKIKLRLTKTRAFGNGNLLTCYAPA
jgi:dihydrofolate reductase